MKSLVRLFLLLGALLPATAVFQNGDSATVTPEMLGSQRGGVPLGEPFRVAARSTGGQASARQHDPLLFDPSTVVSDRTNDAPGSAGVVDSFLAFTSTGWSLPDPEMAVTYGFDTFHEMLYGFLAYTATDEKLNVKVDPSTGHVREN